MKVSQQKKHRQQSEPYSQAYVNNGVLYTSGQLGINPETGNLGGDTIEEQAEWSCKNVGEILKAAGTDYEHVLKTTCFLAILLISEHSMKFMQNISHLNRQKLFCQERSP